MKLRLLMVLPVLATGCLSQKIDDFISGLEPSTGSSGGSEGSSSGGAEGSSSEGSSSEGSVGDSGSGAAETGLVTESETEAVDGSGSETEAGSSSGEGPGVCGDGVMGGDEECDDGNEVPDDGCSDTCAADVRVFVTSTSYKGGELMSPYLADTQCLHRAKDAGLPNYTRFKVWLSDSKQDARDRFNRDRRGRLVMVNGLVLAASWEALLAGELENPLEVTEKSETYHGPVWTGTMPDGVAAAGSDHCLDWTSDSPVEKAYYGYSDEISPEWTMADQFDNPAPCLAPHAVYCFESF